MWGNRRRHTMLAEKFLELPQPTVAKKMASKCVGGMRKDKDSHLVGWPEPLRSPRSVSASRCGWSGGYRDVGGGYVHSSSTEKEGGSTEVNYTGVTNHVETRQHNPLWSMTNLTTRCSVYEATLIAAHRTECFDNWRVISNRNRDLLALQGYGSGFSSSGKRDTRRESSYEYHCLHQALLRPVQCNQAGIGQGQPRL